MSKKSKDVQIIIITFLAVVASFSGWLVFEGLKDTLGLSNWTPIAKVFGGLGLAWLIYKLGLNKAFKK